MLTLTRKTGERILIGDSIVEIKSARDGKVVVGIQAPRDVKILREELGDKPRPENGRLLDDVQGMMDAGPLCNE